MAKITEKEEQENGYLKFLGTAGARFVMIRQLRASGGIWISSKGANILVDPGPGSLLRCSQSKPKLDPLKLDAIILSHRHLDHSGDINVMIEAMTSGGFKKRGIVFCPQDALTDDPVILKYNRDFPKRIEILKANQHYKAGKFEFQTSMRHIHPVETYGLKFIAGNKTISILTDTKYFTELSEFYQSDILIVYVVFFEPNPLVAHLSFSDVETLLNDIKPKKVILSHFGMTMLTAKPHIQAELLSKKLNLEVVAAYDGMTINFTV